MNAQTIVALAAQRPPNKHLVMMSKRYWHTSKWINDNDQEKHTEFVSKITKAVEYKPNTIVLSIIAFTSLVMAIVILGFAAFWILAIKLLTQNGIIVCIGAILICILILGVFLSIKNQYRYYTSEKYEPIKLITNLEQIFGKPLEAWEDDFDPCAKAEDYLCNLAQKVKAAQNHDDSIPWEEKQGPAARMVFELKLESIAKILPIDEDRGTYFANRVPAQPTRSSSTPRENNVAEPV